MNKISILKETAAESEQWSQMYGGWDPTRGQKIIKVKVYWQVCFHKQGILVHNCKHSKRKRKNVWNPKQKIEKMTAKNLV